MSAYFLYVTILTSGIHTETASDENVSLLGGVHMKLGIIGTGRVGVSFGKYLSLYAPSVQLVGYYGRTKEHVLEASHFTNSQPFETLSTLIQASDTLMIATTDHQIKHIWDCMLNEDITNKQIGHFSGSLSSDIFINKSNKNVHCGSIHPMYAFCDKFQSYQQMNTIALTIEGDDCFTKSFQRVFCETKNPVITINKEHKALYHTAASIASNHFIALYSICEDLFYRANISAKDTSTLLAPLILQNMENVFANGSVASLTGPIERCEPSTISTHMEQLSTYEKQIYQLLGTKLLELSKEKNPTRDYQDIERILKDEKHSDYL